MKRAQKELLTELARSRAKIITAPVLVVKGEAPRVVEKSGLIGLENAGLVKAKPVPGGVIWKITEHGRKRARERNMTPPPPVRTCRVCGCTDLDCRQCIEATGSPCHWVEEDLCSRCASEEGGKDA